MTSLLAYGFPNYDCPNHLSLSISEDKAYKVGIFLNGLIIC